MRAGVGDLLADERILWFLMRGSGVVLLALLTLAVVLGTVSSSRAAPGARPPRRGALPRFALQAVHRDAGVASLALLAVHAVSAAAHGYVEIRWVDLVVPFAGPYEPLWIGTGTLALDLLAAAAVTAALRDRLGPRAWQAVHLVTYPAWVLSVVHAAGIGTDRERPWALAVAAVCVAAFLVAVAYRLVTLRRGAAPVPAPATARVPLGPGPR